MKGAAPRPLFLPSCTLDSAVDESDCLVTTSKSFATLGAKLNTADNFSCDRAKSRTIVDLDSGLRDHPY